MKANQIIKKPIPIEEIHERIKSAVEMMHNKAFIPHFEYVNDDTIFQLIDDGFKVYKGEWDTMRRGYIIEW